MAEIPSVRRLRLGTQGLQVSAQGSDQIHSMPCRDGLDRPLSDDERRDGLISNEISLRHIYYNSIYIHELACLHLHPHAKDQRSQGTVLLIEYRGESRAMAEIPSVRRLRLGSQGLEVSAQGLGCMGMSAFYGPPKPEQEMISLIHHAVSRGVTFLDTSDVYGPFTNEILVGKAIKGIREKVQLATKFGGSFVDGKLKVRGDPAYVRACCEASLKRLDVDCIDLYYQHRIDTKVPIEVTIGELKKLVEEGKIKYIGLSEASPATIRRAHAVHPITAIQLEWSLWTRDVEDQVIPTCRELGIGIVPYSPLGQGFLSSGAKLVENLTSNDARKTKPRLTEENLEKNKVTFAKIAEIASRKGCSPGQLSLAWIFHQGNDISPIPGTTKVANLEENIGALSVKITHDEMKEIENILSTYRFSGNRYEKNHEQFTWMNSETPPLSSWKDAI